MCLNKLFVSRTNIGMLICLAWIAVYSSCSKRKSSIDLYYQKDIISVWDRQPDVMLDTTQYSLDLFAFLTFPSQIKNLKCEKMEYVNGFFYLLDTEYNKTVFVFDSDGNFVSQLGRRGRASNEYLDKPTNFFVQAKDSQIMVYERNAHRIHYYDNKGGQTELQVLKIWPYDAGTMFDGHFVAAFDYKEAGRGMQLGVYDSDEKLVTPVIELGENHVYVDNERSFKLSGEDLYHIPHFSDSVYVFHSDTLSKIIHLRFESLFLPSEIIKEVDKGDLEKYRSFRGIMYVSDYYETNGYVSFLYSKNHVRKKCIIDKTNNNQYHFTNAPFKGLFPGDKYAVDGESIYWLVCEDDVVDLNFALENEVVKTELSHTYSLIRDIIQGKYSLPLIVKINIEHQ